MQEMSRKNQYFTDSVIRRMTRISLDCGAISVCISGAGPTILCVASDDNFIRRMSMAAAKDLPGWEVRELPIDRVGVTCEKIES